MRKVKIIRSVLVIHTSSESFHSITATTTTVIFITNADITSTTVITAPNISKIIIT